MWARERVVRVRTDRVFGIGHRSPPSGITRHDFGSGAGHARRARSPAAVSATEEPILPPGRLPAQEGEVEDGCAPGHEESEEREGKSGVGDGGAPAMGLDSHVVLAMREEGEALPSASTPTCHFCHSSMPPSAN